jgi:hypothetical protein
MSRQPGDVHAPRLDVEEEQHINLDPSAQSPHLLGEKITGPQPGGVSFDEVVPGVFAPFGAGVEARLAQDIDHRRAADLADAEFLQLAEDARVAPIVLTGQPQHQFADRLGRARSAGSRGTGALRVLPSLGVKPTEEGSRRHDRDQFLERRSERPAEPDQPSAFLRRYLHNARQLGTQNLVLDFEELDVTGQRFVGGLGQKQQQSVDRGSHRAYHRKLLAYRGKTEYLNTAAGAKGRPAEAKSGAPAPCAHKGVRSGRPRRRLVPA